MKCFLRFLGVLSALTLNHIVFYLYANITNTMGLSYLTILSALLILAIYILSCKEKKRNAVLGGFGLIFSILLFGILELSGTLRVFLIFIKS